MRKNVHRWLSLSDVEDYLHRHQLEHMPGFCSVNDSSKCLKPKAVSTLSTQARWDCSAVLGPAKEFWHPSWSSIPQTDNIVLLFFCKAGETEKQKNTHVLRPLLSQLLHNNKALYRDVESLYTTSGRATAESYIEVHSALILALAKTTRTAFILVDALDESQDVGNLLQALFEATSVAGGM